MPYKQSKSDDVQYYSYTIGQLHVVSLSGESDRLASNTTEEMRWLKADLADAAAAREVITCV
jgi:hypothetical protein